MVSILPPAEQCDLSVEVPIDEIQVSAYNIPAEEPESDGTLQWSHTTLVLVEITGGGTVGIGYTYADRSTALLIQSLLAEQLIGKNALTIPARIADLVRAIRNLGRQAICAMAISAVDCALWDLKAKILNLSLATLLGQARERVEIYGSGGFTSYDQSRLCRQLSRWAAEGIRHVKMKIGRDPAADIQRVSAVRQAIGEKCELFVDANGAYSRKQALAQAEAFAKQGVVWFEEPVSSDDLEGLRLLRDRGPAGMNIAAGEYGYNPMYFRRMLEAQSVDVLQADATRCGGITGFLQVDALCTAYQLGLSAHCAPALHLPACCAVRKVVHQEYFYDHVRIEQMLFDGAVLPRDGTLQPDLSRPGLGLEFKRSDAARWQVAI
jgi:L-alanine-DL-glutamate epimerase-like enolase superfamily enzyme